VADGPDDSRWDHSEPSGATPLGPEELDGLIPSWVATRAELNTVEQQNVIDGLSRPRWRGMPLDRLLDDYSVRRLHADMFGQVWRWAGKYRQQDMNIGVDWHTVGVAVRDLVADATFWFAGDRPMTADEAGYQFHHRLVQIHPFPNGNGRHARAMTDLLLAAIGTSPFTWGSVSLNSTSAVRDAYIAALRAADRDDFTALAAFVRR
jgi:Fic-DOC domain mobile mystery protein B